jgi:predicted CoA-binding protein
MSLYATLQKVQSEEDVKDVYIKALGLKKITKGLIDIQTNEVWFEAKDKPKSTYEMRIFC